VGAENFFLFGLTAPEVQTLQRGGYRPGDYLDGDAELAEAIELIASGHFSNGDRSVFAPLVDNLRHHDPFLVLADYRAYVGCQDQVSAAWQDVDRWTRMSILNTARAGKFSSDRSIREYCDDLWQVSAAPVA
jgi:starch phosphorylase